MIEHIQDQLLNHVMALAILQLSDNLEFLLKKRQFSTYSYTSNACVISHLVMFLLLLLLRFPAAECIEWSGGCNKSIFIHLKINLKP